MGKFTLQKRRCRERKGVSLPSLEEEANFLCCSTSQIPAVSTGVGSFQVLVAGDAQAKAVGSPLGLTGASVPDVWFLDQHHRRHPELVRMQNLRPPPHL